jgi:hypothetical protein
MQRTTMNTSERQRRCEMKRTAAQLSICWPSLVFTVVRCRSLHQSSLIDSVSGPDLK